MKNYESVFYAQKKIMVRTDPWNITHCYILSYRLDCPLSLLRILTLLFFLPVTVIQDASISHYSIP